MVSVVPLATLGVGLLLSACALLAVWLRSRPEEAREPCPPQKILFSKGVPVPILNYHSHCDEKATKRVAWIVCGDAGIEEICQKVPCSIVSETLKCFELVGSEEELQSALEHTPAGVTAHFVERVVEFTAYSIPEENAEPEWFNPSFPTWNMNQIGRHLRPNTGTGIKIILADSGARQSHSQFGPGTSRVIYGGKDFTTGPSGVDCTLQTCYTDPYGHGTYIASVMIGKDVGVAPGAELIPFKVLNDNGVFTSSVAMLLIDQLSQQVSAYLGGYLQALQYDPNQAILAFGFGHPHYLRTWTKFLDIIAGTYTVVAAAGNDHKDACRVTPAYHPRLITVGSCDRFDGRSHFSNFGPCVDIWAPGRGIPVASRFHDDKLVARSGTSLALAHVVGALAVKMSPGSVQRNANLLAHLRSVGKWGQMTRMTVLDNNVQLWMGSSMPPNSTSTRTTTTTTSTTTGTLAAR